MNDLVAEHGTVRLAYDVRGSDHAPPLLLITGIKLRRAHWGEHFLSALATKYRVVTFDNRGTGDSTRPVDDITSPLWMGDALAVLDAAGCHKAHVLGFSMGGRIAQELVVRHPERVDHLMLMSSAIGGPHATAPVPEVAKWFFPLFGVTAEEARRQSLISVTGPGFEERHPTRLEELIELSRHKDTSSAMLQKQIGVLATDVLDQLSGIRHPTLIAHGTQDGLVPIANGEELGRRLPEARFERFEGMGHLLHWECPEHLLPSIFGFFA